MTTKIIFSTLTVTLSFCNGNFDKQSDFPKLVVGVWSLSINIFGIYLVWFSRVANCQIFFLAMVIGLGYFGYK